MKNIRTLMTLFVVIAFSTPIFSQTSLVYLNPSILNKEVSISSIETTEKNKEIIHKLYYECLNTGKLEFLNEIISEEYVSPSGEKGVAGFTSTIGGVLKAFPDIRFTIEDIIAEGDKVVVRWQWAGTHKEAFQQFSASHKRVVNQGIVIYQFKDHKIIGNWLQMDRLGVLQQIGVIEKDLGGKSPGKKVD